MDINAFNITYEQEVEKGFLKSYFPVAPSYNRFIQLKPRMLLYLIFYLNLAGGAIIPKLFAGLKENYNFQLVFFALVIPWYLYIFYYAVKGHKAGKANLSLRIQKV